ncbi:MAG: HAMP domain-containing protein, partial [Delftia sp.]|nr:HAMP domain-containing protein [Delftia sp.]
MRYSLRTRLVLSFFSVIVVTAGLVVALADRITTDRFTYLVSNTGQAHAHELALLFADYYARVGSWEGVESLMPASAMQSQGEHHARHDNSMMGAGGESCASLADIMPLMGMADTDNEHLLLIGTAGRIVADSAGQSANLHLAATDLERGTPIVVGGKQVGTLIVASGLGVLSPQQNAFLSQANQLMIVAAIITGLAVLLVGSFQARRIVAPVRALADAARRVAAGDLAQRVPVTSQDELGEMAVAFNT